MVGLEISVFVPESSQVQPNKRVCVKQKSVDSNILQSMLFKVPGIRHMMYQEYNI